MSKFSDRLNKKIEEAEDKPKRRRRRPRRPPSKPAGRYRKPKPQQRELSREEELALKPSIMGEEPPEQPSQGRYYTDEDLTSIRKNKAAKLVTPMGKNLFKIRYSDQSGWENRDIEYWTIARKGMAGYEVIHQIKVGKLKEGDIVALPDAGAFPLRLSPVRIKGSGEKDESTVSGRPGAKPGFITTRDPSVPPTHVPGGKFYMHKSFPSGGPWNVRYLNLRTGEEESIQLSPKTSVAKVFGRPKSEEDPEERVEKAREGFEKSEKVIEKAKEKRRPPRARHWAYREPEPEPEAEREQ